MYWFFGGRCNCEASGFHFGDFLRAELSKFGVETDGVEIDENVLLVKKFKALFRNQPPQVSAFNF